jgi:hypothetical protein
MLNTQYISSNGDQSQISMCGGWWVMLYVLFTGVTSEHQSSARGAREFSKSVRAYLGLPGLRGKASGFCPE